MKPSGVSLQAHGVCVYINSYFLYEINEVEINERVSSLSVAWRIIARDYGREDHAIGKWPRNTRW